ncbi:hypothetical protein PLICRDRAFT_178309 [Plicaturopsis crispa FD-325 SS-3]|nr:hypothetical protein PLICRDRAFT_178309 [Plicaturopsis crispa FD-325 SS-3]
MPPGSLLKPLLHPSQADIPSGSKSDKQEESMATLTVEAWARTDLRLRVYKWIGRLMADDSYPDALDEAFGYALQKATYLPVPSNRHGMLGRHTLGLTQATWNSDVDKYIKLGTDPRPKEDIERAAKIGLYHGALYRKCEGPECTKLERRDLVKLQTCSRCSITPYCGKSCQAAAWRVHKPVCGSVDQQAQPLSAQMVLYLGVQTAQDCILSDPQQALDNLGPDVFNMLLDGIFMGDKNERENLKLKAALKY